MAKSIRLGAVGTANWLFVRKKWTDLMIRNRATDEGREIGTMLARFCDDAEPRARLRLPQLPPRCQSCAFRAGPHVANGSPETQMDALKCVMEGVEFRCHQPDREGQICSGWAMMMLANDEPGFGIVPWPFSDEAKAHSASRESGCSMDRGTNKPAE